MARRAAGGTPATVALTRAGVGFTLHEYTHDPRAESFGLEAAERSAMAALLPPRARASALRSSCPDTGTTATASRPSTVAMRVLKTRTGSRPRASAASSPNDSARGSWVYSCSRNAMPARASATVAGVPPLDLRAMCRARVPSTSA